MAALRTLEAAGKGEITRRVLSIASRNFMYGMVMRHAQTDLMAGIEDGLKPKPQVQHSPDIVEPAKLGALLRAIDGCLGEISTRCALKILPYCPSDPAS